MPGTETLSAPRYLRSEVGRVASRIWEKALEALNEKPGFKEIKEQVEGGRKGFYSFASDQGNISASFIPMQGVRVLSITRAWQEEDGSHSESTHAVAETVFLGVWELCTSSIMYNLSWLEYEKDGVTVFDREAVEGSIQLLEKVKQAKPLPQK